MELRNFFCEILVESRAVFLSESIGIFLQNQRNPFEKRKARKNCFAPARRNKTKCMKINIHLCWNR